jgi:hypothetical protein
MKCRFSPSLQLDKTSTTFGIAELLMWAFETTSEVCTKSALMKRDCELHPMTETESREDMFLHLQEKALGELRPVTLVALSYLKQFP